jgi:hypothetical protein
MAANAAVLANAGAANAGAALNAAATTGDAAIGVWETHFVDTFAARVVKSNMRRCTTSTTLSDRMTTIDDGYDNSIDNLLATDGSASLARNQHFEHPGARRSQEERELDLFGDSFTNILVSIGERCQGLPQVDPLLKKSLYDDLDDLRAKTATAQQQLQQLQLQLDHHHHHHHHHQQQQAPAATQWPSTFSDRPFGVGAGGTGDSRRNNSMCLMSP